MKSLIASISTLALITGLAACTKKEDAALNAAPEEAEITLEDLEGPTTEALQTATDLLDEEENAPEADGKERFYGKRAFTIVSTQTGAEEGDVTEHVRDWGRLRAEVKDTSISIAGFTQATNQRIIYDGADITTVDETSGAVTTATNPIYNAMVARMKGKSGVEFGKEMMTQMGGRVTDEKAKFAGHDCTYWELPSLGGKACVTDWGGTLHTVVAMAGVSMEKTATQVRMGDGGPDSVYQFDASKAQEAPNLEDIMKQLNAATNQ